MEEEAERCHADRTGGSAGRHGVEIAILALMNKPLNTLAGEGVEKIRELVSQLQHKH